MCNVIFHNKSVCIRIMISIILVCSPTKLYKYDSVKSENYEFR